MIYVKAIDCASHIEIHRVGYKEEWNQQQKKSKSKE